MWIRLGFKALISRSRAQWLAGLLVALGVGAVTLYVTRPLEPGRVLAPSGRPDPLSSAEIQTILSQDAIGAVDDPHFVAANRAGMRDDLHIIGVAQGDQAHAYPISFMSRVEIVNDRLGGKNIAVTW